MRHILLALLFLSGSYTGLFAADGYTIKLKFTNYADKKVFLAHYYGKPLPTIYKVDSAVVDKNGVAILETKTSVIGGLYLVVLEDNARYFEFLLDNGQQIEANVTVARLPLGVTFKNSPENEKFFKYMSFLSDIGKEQKALTEDLSKASTHTDSVKVQQNINELSRKVTAFRKDYIKQNPGTLLSNIFNALEMPPVPMVTKADGTQDTEAWYRNYKKIYWDNVAFDDERLVYTPLLDNRLDIYFSKLVMAVPDSFNADADALISKARVSKEMFKFIVHWITKYAEESDVMGMDAVFVHMVENYYMKGDAYWLSQEAVEKYMERARSIAPNVIGNIGPDIKMTKMDGGEMRLSTVKAKYTLLVFWSPDCGHCLEEVPRVDSVIRAMGLEKKGLEVIAFNVDKDTSKWKNIIKEKKLERWTHVHDAGGKSDFRAQYDVYGTPSIYLLDERKIIRGKKLDHSNVGIVMEMLESNVTSKK